MEVSIRKIIKLIHLEIIKLLNKRRIPITAFFGLPYLICWCAVIIGMICASVKKPSGG